MNNKFTKEDLQGMSSAVRLHFEKMVKSGHIIEGADNYYFGTTEDPYAEHPKHKLEVLEYVVWNLAYLTYKATNHA